MTFRCSYCETSWYPYQCRTGTCPDCGGGTMRTNDPASQIARERHERLAETPSAKRYAANVIDALVADFARKLAKLPTVEGPRP